MVKMWDNITQRTLGCVRPGRSIHLAARIFHGSIECNLVAAMPARRPCCFHYGLRVAGSRV